MDPLILQIIASAFALLFAAAAVHKFVDRIDFEAALAAYDLLPAFMTGAMSRLLPVFEAATAICWALSLFISELLVPAALLSIVLLSTYSVAVFINLARGRRWIDCGCGAARHPISRTLVSRNLFLVGVAVVAMTPAVERDLLWIDAFTLLLAVAALAAFWNAANQLLANGAVIASWRMDP